MSFNVSRNIKNTRQIKGNFNLNTKIICLNICLNICWKIYVYLNYNKISFSRNY